MVGKPVRFRHTPKTVWSALQDINNGEDPEAVRKKYEVGQTTLLGWRIDYQNLSADDIGAVRRREERIETLLDEIERIRHKRLPRVWLRGQQRHEYGRKPLGERSTLSQSLSETNKSRKAARSDV